VRVGGLVGRRVLWLSAHGGLKLPAERSAPAGSRAKNNGAPASCRDAVSFNGTSVRTPRRRPSYIAPLTAFLKAPSAENFGALLA
jgi:hypothetical protein